MNQQLFESKISPAEEMAELTCELAKTCNEKENHFAAMFNLTPAEFKCFRLFTTTNVLSIKEITYLMNITPGRTTHILTSLESKYIVERKIDPLDKRNIKVHLTENSKPLLEKINTAYIKMHENILEEIEPNNRDIIIEAMKKVKDAIKHLPGD